jgi:hypothetical protein
MHGYPNDSRDAVFRREDVFTLTESPTALQLPLFAEAVPAGFQARQVIT